jgi:hypothetical protein
VTRRYTPADEERADVVAGTADTRASTASAGKLTHPDAVAALLADGARAGLWATLADLDAAAGLPPCTAAPGLHAAQERLF